MDNTFETLNALNVNEHTETKTAGGTALTYLSWAWAWAETKKRFPEAHYEIYKNMENGLPYVCDPQTGYMVYTSVTIGGITHEMWLPVMDSANHAMKTEPYTIKTKYKEVPVAAATMMDINKAIMRCLTKNLAMFGLGLYIYAGEDLPDAEPEPEPEKKPEPPKKQEAKKPAEIICERCGKPVKPVKGKDGKTFTVDMVVDQSKLVLGDKVCCAACLKAIQLEAKRKKAESGGK